MKAPCLVSKRDLRLKYTRPLRRACTLAVQETLRFLWFSGVGGGAGRRDRYREGGMKEGMEEDRQEETKTTIGEKERKKQERKETGQEGRMDGRKEVREGGREGGREGSFRTFLNIIA